MFIAEFRLLDASLTVVAFPSPFKALDTEFNIPASALVSCSVNIFSTAPSNISATLSFAKHVSTCASTNGKRLLFTQSLREFLRASYSLCNSSFVLSTRLSTTFLYCSNSFFDCSNASLVLLTVSLIFFNISLSPVSSGIKFEINGCISFI